MTGCPDCNDGWANRVALYRVADGVWKCLKHARLAHPEALARLRRDDDNEYEIEHLFRVRAGSPGDAAIEARRVLRDCGFHDPIFFVKARPE